jgi:phosphatidylglycerophosphatase A
VKPAAEITWTDRLLETLLTSFGLGYSPILPGTCGSLPAVVYYLIVDWMFPDEPMQSWLLALMIMATCVLTVAAGRWAEGYFGTKDNSAICTDEVAGMLLTLLFFRVAGMPWLTLAWVFPVTRVFDIVKLPPVRWLEKFPRGWGVLVDDLWSAMYGVALLWFIWWLSTRLGMNWFGPG